MSVLRSAFIYQRSAISLLDRAPFLELVPHPDPGQRILIVRTLTRIHNHSGQLQHPDSLLTVLFRASDGAPIGGAVLDSSPASIGGASAALATAAWDQEEFNFAPDGFLLEPGDSLGVVTSHEPRVGINGHTCSVNVLIAWQRVAPKFILLEALEGGESATRRVLGLKDDGSLWRTEDARATPVVWTRVDGAT